MPFHAMHIQHSLSEEDSGRPDSMISLKLQALPELFISASLELLQWFMIDLISVEWRGTYSRLFPTLKMRLLLQVEIVAV